MNALSERIDGLLAAGKNAYMEGDFPEATRKWEELIALVEEQDRQGVRWQDAPWKENYLFAYYNDGYAYYSKRNPDRNVEQAMRRFERAAKGGLPIAMLRCGDICRKGELGEKDYAAAERWYKSCEAALENKSRVRDSSDSDTWEEIYWGLSEIYKEGGWGIEADEQAAKKYAHEAENMHSVNMFSAFSRG